MKRHLLAALVLVLLAVTPRTAHGAPEGWVCGTDAVYAAGQRLEEVKVFPSTAALSELSDPAAQPLTRARFAVALVAAMGRVDEAAALQGDTAFSDMRENWAAKYVTLLAQDGIVKGYPDGAFQPDRNITLPEAKFMLVRMLRLGNPLTVDSADEALRSAGIDTTVPACGNPWYAARGQLFQLLDRVMQTTMYSRFPQVRLDVAPAEASAPAGTWVCATPEVRAAITRLGEANLVFPDVSSDLEPKPPAAYPVSRARMAAMVVRALGREDEARTLQGAPSFTDLPDHWAASYVMLLAQDGMVKGYPGGEVRPSETITWPEAELMLARMLRLGGSLTQDSADAALKKAGIDTAVPACPAENGRPSQAQVYLLLDRVMESSMYSRLKH